MTFLLAWWPELTGAGVIVAASLWLTWALSSSVLPSLILGVPFGCGVGGLIAAARTRPPRRNR